MLTRRKYFASDLYTTGLPPGFFTHFLCSTAENYESVFLTSVDQMVLLTGVRPNGAFDRRSTKTWIRSFWRSTIGQILKIMTWRDFGPLRQWSRKFPSRIFYPFWAPHSQKLWIGLFGRRATKWCFWLACDRNQSSVFLTVVRQFPYFGTFNQWCDWRWVKDPNVTFC